MKKALITGIRGQDGFYLTKLLKEKNYKVIGIERRISESRNDDLVYKNVKIYQGDISNKSTVTQVIKNEKPNEIYNLGAQSHVGYSFKEPEITMEATGQSVLYILEAIKNYSPKTKIYQAGTSELFGNNRNMVMNEKTKFDPCSPYACAKLYAHFLIKTYRKSYGIFASNGILFNHESPRRGDDFVTQKIIKGIYHWVKTKEPFELGNIEAKRDWGHASDYVRAMNLILQHKKPDDFVIAMGETRTVKDFINIALNEFDIKAKWQGKGTEARLLQKGTKNLIITISKDLYRPAEVPRLKGDPKKAKKLLNWKPEYTFKELIREMIIKKQK